ARKFGTRTHPTMEAVLQDNKIDAVLLTTPHSLHAEHVAAAARAGKHVFVEKPFTLDQKSAKSAAAACKQANVVLAVGQNRRFSAIAQELRRMLDAGEFGTLLHIEGNFSSPSATKWPANHWRASRQESPAGGLAGLGIHIIDLITWLGGPAMSVVGLAKRRALEIDIDDTTSALMDLASGATAYLGTLCASPFTIFSNVYGTKASAFAQIDADELRVQPVGKEPVTKPLTPVNTVLAELDEFADACAGRATFRVSPEEATHNVAVMESIARSAQDGGRVIRINS
ncbi:MAG: Gfo/Idh/MocA family protein, partial [Aestuariivirgaceae bacterium]